MVSTLKCLGAQAGLSFNTLAQACIASAHLVHLYTGTRLQMQTLRLIHRFHAMCFQVQAFSYRVARKQSSQHQSTTVEALAAYLRGTLRVHITGTIKQIGMMYTWLKPGNRIRQCTTCSH